MIHRGLVLLSVPVALAAAYFAADWPQPERTRLRGSLRTGRHAVAAAPAADAASPAETAPPTTAPAPKAEPAKPAPAPPQVRVRTIEDVKLPVSSAGQDLVLAKLSEIHVDVEGSMTWHGGGAVNEMKTFRMLGEGLRQRQDAPLVLVADAQTPWQTIRWMLLAAQDNFVSEAYLGVASAAAPQTLRILPIRQTPRSDDPLPEGDVFTVSLRVPAEGVVEIAANGTPLVDAAADLRAAWDEWRKARPDVVATPDPAKTRVVLDAPRSAPVAAVVTAIDAMRAAGIESERYGGQIPPRPR